MRNTKLTEMSSKSTMTMSLGIKLNNVISKMNFISLEHLNDYHPQMLMIRNPLNYNRMKYLLMCNALWSHNVQFMICDVK